MGLEGYTGPTSGRITIRGDEVISRESFHDAPLTRDELNATADFRAMSPNEQIREVRRLKWNEAHWRGEAENLKQTVQRLDDELAKVGGKLATYPPEGYTLPRAAAELIEHAKAHGWSTGRAWRINDDLDGATVQVLVTSSDSTRLYKLSWSCDPGGAGRMTHSGLARLPLRGWRDAPSLKKIREDIAAHSGTSVTSRTTE